MKSEGCLICLFLLFVLPCSVATTKPLFVGSWFTELYGFMSLHRTRVKWMLVNTVMNITWLLLKFLFLRSEGLLKLLHISKLLKMYEVLFSSDSLNIQHLQVMHHSLRGYWAPFVAWLLDIVPLLYKGFKTAILNMRWLVHFCHLYHSAIVDFGRSNLLLPISDSYDIWRGHIIFSSQNLAPFQFMTKVVLCGNSGFLPADL